MSRASGGPDTPQRNRNKIIPDLLGAVPVKESGFYYVNEFIGTGYEHFSPEA